eukprot:802709_1
MALSTAKCLIFSLLSTVSQSQVEFWSEAMNSASLPTDWTSTGTNPWVFTATDPQSKCPLSKSYCWDFTGVSMIATTAATIDTSQHTNIELSYSVRITNRPGSPQGECILEYSTDGTTTYQSIRTYTPTDDNTDETATFNAWNPSADSNTNG